LQGSYRNYNYVHACKELFLKSECLSMCLVKDALFTEYVYLNNAFIEESY